MAGMAAPYGAVLPCGVDEDVLAEKDALLEPAPALTTAKEPVTALEAGVILSKCCIGLGWLSIASGLVHFELGGGLIFACLFIAMNAYGMSCLATLFLDCAAEQAMQHEIPDGIEAPALTYNMLAAHVLGSWAGSFVECSILISSLGGAMVTSLFLSASAHALVPGISAHLWTLIIMVPVILLNQIRELKLLANNAWIGLLAVVGTMLFIFVVSVNLVLTDGVANGVHTGIAIGRLGSFFGVFYYSMDYSISVGPVVVSMQKQSQQHASSVVIAVSTISGLIYFIVGLAGALAFGSDAKDPLSANLTQDGLSDTLVGVLAFSILVTFPLSLYPVAEIIDNRFPQSPATNRLGLVALPMLASLGISSMTDAMGLCTGLIGVVLNCLLPATLYWSRFKETLGWFDRIGLATLLIGGGTLGIACFWHALIDTVVDS